MSKDRVQIEISERDTVGAVVARQPGLSRVFERAGIDYCCGGKKPLDSACRESGIDPVAFLEALRAEAGARDESEPDVASMSLTDLADHIERTHHAYLNTEMPRLRALTEKVASVHGDRDARLAEVRETFHALAMELDTHMMKEERILFPMVRQCDAAEEVPEFHCGSIANPIRQMEAEHDEAGTALARLRELTNGYTPPEWACNTYRAMLDALIHFESDLHQHIHKENNILFPRALAVEEERRGLRA